jgi:hypothetical protein
VGQQGPVRETERAKAATGAVNSDRPGRRSAGLSYLHLRRQFGCVIESAFSGTSGDPGVPSVPGRTRLGSGSATSASSPTT